MFWGCHWIRCTLRCNLTANMWLLPGFRLNLPCKKSPRMENSADPGFARSHLDPPEGGIKCRAILETGCLGWGRIRRDSPCLAGVLGYLRGSPVCLWCCCIPALWVQLYIRQCETRRTTSMFNFLISFITLTVLHSSFLQSCFKVSYEFEVHFHKQHHVLSSVSFTVSLTHSFRYSSFILYPFCSLLSLLVQNESWLGTNQASLLNHTGNMCSLHLFPLSTERLLWPIPLFV